MLEGWRILLGARGIWAELNFSRTAWRHWGYRRAAHQQQNNSM